MGRWCTVSLLCAVLAFSTTVCRTAANDPPAADVAPLSTGSGFISLFNGRDLDGWAGLEGYWSVVDGCIVGRETREHSKQTFLIRTGAHFGDFELRLRYRFFSPEGNSGIQIRSAVLDPNAFKVGGYQADFDAAARFDGSIYDEAGSVGNRGTLSRRGEATVWDAAGRKQTRPLAQGDEALRKLIRLADWNDALIRVKGPRITYVINGHMMTDLVDETPFATRDGILALQLHEGFDMDVRFKDISVRILEKQPFH